MQLTIQLDQFARRPIARLGWFNDCRALIDTGALFRYIDMPIVVKTMNDLNCHMILSATMFENMVYTIDTIHKYFYIDTVDNQIVRILRISDEYGKFSAYLAGTYMTVEDYKNCLKK